MKVHTAFMFDETQLRTVRAAIGRGGKATRKEARVFIDRAIHAALDAAPEPKPKRATAVLHIVAPIKLEETEKDEVARRREVRRKIEQKFGHKGTGVARG